MSSRSMESTISELFMAEAGFYDPATGDTVGEYWRDDFTSREEAEAWLDELLFEEGITRAVIYKKTPDYWDAISYHNYSDAS